MDISSAEYGKPNEIRFFSVLFEGMPKKGVTYFLVFVLTALLPCFFLVLAVKWDLPVHTAKIIYILSMLLVGTGHIFSFPKWLKDLYPAGIKDRLLYSFLLAIAILFCSLLLFMLTDFAKPLWSLAGTCGFLLPASIQVSWKYFDAIAEKVEYDPWLLPLTVPEPRVSLFLRSFPIRLQLKLNLYDLKEKTFVITVPMHLKLGEMFHRFLLDKEATYTAIQLVDSEQESFAWRFTLKRMFGNKMLNPGDTFIESGIKRNNIILAERVRITLPEQIFVNQ